MRSRVFVNLVRGIDAVEGVNCSELEWDSAVQGLTTQTT